MLAYGVRASAASEGCVIMCHKPTVWHIGTLKYSHQPEETEAFIELRTDESLQFTNSFT